MPHAPTPWIGLAALAAMFVLPWLPDWLFEGPRTVRHRPRQHVCADCRATWTNDHVCSPTIDAAYPPLQAQRRGLAPPSGLARPQPEAAARTVAAPAPRVHGRALQGRPGHPCRADRAILGRSQRPPAAARGEKTSKPRAD
jgi:hypothetical protein